MLKLLDLEQTVSNLTPVTSPDFYMGKTTTFHPEGLFSEKIFGPVETPDRRKTYSYIELNCKVLHPALYPVIRRLKRSILDAMTGDNTYSIQNGELVLDKEGNISGISSLIDNFDKIEFRTDSKIREDLVKMVEYYRRQRQVFIDKVYVIPPDYRNIEITDMGDIIVNPINEYYGKIIRLSLQLSSRTSGEIFDVLSFRMNEYVRDLYDFLTSKISKKSGLLRGHILGKRVDFTARAVISGAASEIRPDQIGVPFKLLVKLFEPFIIYELLSSGRTPKEELAVELEKHDGSKLSALSLRRLFLAIHKHDEVNKRLLEILQEATNRAMEGKVVLAKRDPSLHAESIQAFYPVMIQGNTIKLHPLKCSSYNADFDGDQMALYVPITRQAIEEAKDKMMTAISKDAIDKIGDSFDKDTAIGLYVLTKEPMKKPSSLNQVTGKEDLSQYNIHQWVKFNGEETTVGRIIFNQILPEKMPYLNEALNAKKINKLAHLIYNKYGKDEYLSFADQAVKLSYKYGTIGSLSFSLEDLEIPDTIKKKKQNLKQLSTQDADNVIRDVTKELGNYLENKDGNLGNLGKAGSLKGGYDQTRQILVSKGLIEDNEGNVMEPIPESYSEGLNSKDFFMSGAGSRRGISDRVLNTADTGYLSRQLVYALQRVEADPNLFTCGTTKAFNLKVTPDIVGRLKGRYIIGKNGRPVLLDPQKALGKVIPLKSPLYCLSPKICKTCYGDLLERNRTPFVGVLAAQIFGERGTQMIMKTFHSGGAISVNTVDITQDILKGIDDKLIPTVNKAITQRKNSLYATTQPIKLVIDKREYLDDTKDIKINQNEKRIYLEYGYLKLYINNKTLIDVALDTKTEIDISNNQPTIKDNLIIIDFKPKQEVLMCPPATDSFSDKVRIIQHLLSGKKPWKSGDHFAMKVYDQYGPLTDADMVHFEILASQLLRDKGNPSYPARLNKNYNPMVGNLKKIPSLESWLSALSFENPSLAITTGLIYEREQRESVLEKIVNGSL